MTKTDILENNWEDYVEAWKTKSKDVSKPPTEERFWVWYCLGVLD